MSKNSRVSTEKKGFYCRVYFLVTIEMFRCVGNKIPIENIVLHLLITLRMYKKSLTHRF